MTAKNIVKKAVACVCMGFGALLTANYVSASGRGREKLKPRTSVQNTASNRQFHRAQGRVKPQDYHRFVEIFGHLPGMTDFLKISVTAPAANGEESGQQRDNETCVNLSELSKETVLLYKDGKFDISGETQTQARETVISILTSNGFGCTEFKVYEWQKKKQDGTFSDSQETVLTSVPYVLGVEQGYRCYSYLDAEGNKVVKVFTPAWQAKHPNC